MNKRIKVACLSMLLSSAVAGSFQPAWAQISKKPASKTTANAKGATPQFDLPFEKYKLPNGLEVVLHQDKSDPKVAVAIMYHVGSSREKEGRTGFAHFFEHMLFQNSENVGKGNFIKNVNQMGGTFNGGTFTDGTVYYEVVPKDALERILWMESDRMGFFINTVSEWGLENEKQVVKNEKRQRVDNQPYGHTNYVILKNLYPSSHPYNWEVIGSLEDLQNATLADVKEFYEQWYGASNATLVLTGDFESADAKKLIAKYFGELKTKPEVKKLTPQPVKLATTKSVFHVDNFANLPELTMVYPTVEQYHKDSYALSMLGSLLSDGKNSPFERIIVEEKKLAPGASAGQSSAEIAGTFRVRVRAFDKKDLDDVQAAVFAAFDKFEKDGVNEKELERLKIRQETALYNGISSLLNKAFQLAQYNEFAGDPGFAKKDIAMTQAVTAQDIMNVYRKYIKGKPYVMTSFVPKGQEELAVKGAVKAEVVEEKVVAGAEGANTGTEPTTFAKTPSKIDRSKMPELSNNFKFTPPAIWTSQLKNGLKVYGIEQNELPLVQFSIQLKGGMQLDAPSKIGTAALVDAMLMEGTKNKTPQQLEEAIGQLGAFINVSSSSENITISGNTLARNFPQVMKLVEEILLEPRWDEAAFAKAKQAALTQIRQTQANPMAVASLAFNKVLYGDGSRFAYPTAGTTETVQGITLQDLKDYYQKNFSPSIASFQVAGAVKQAEVAKALAGLEQKWAAKNVALPTPVTATAKPAARLYFIDQPEAKQSVIYAGYLAVPVGSPDYAALQAINHKLGAGSASTLFNVLRLQKGYTYGAGSGFSRRPTAPGMFAASSSVRTNVTKESLQTLDEILKTYGTSYTEQDLATTKGALIKETALNYETLGSLVSLLETINTYNLPLDYLKQNESAIQNLSYAQAKSLINNYIDPNKMVYVVVGDAKTQLAGLKDLGLGEPVVLENK
ncbi:M16 family metallopeptidase [Rufibacter glacialis]|uniref:Insulinase family protein n=1 Tax=Rufibacter glacialis TaxID=1259555 RepID=A0A5M8QTK9_9BACT|nr:pitrilysin family protein [Rufibacter glacialis]KAA6438194.1 insulinase family protein [Rufibacter glacialis]